MKSDSKLKGRTVICLLMILIISCVFCSSVFSAAREITDMEGNKIMLPLKNARYAVFGGPISQIPYILGAQDSVVAVTKGPQMMELMIAIDPGIKKKPHRGQPMGM